MVYGIYRMVYGMVTSLAMHEPRLRPFSARHSSRVSVARAVWHGSPSYEHTPCSRLKIVRTLPLRLTGLASTLQTAFSPAACVGVLAPAGPPGRPSLYWPVYTLHV